MSVTLLGTAFLAVLLAELVGDKLLYTTGSLAARFGATSVLAGLAPALAAKSLVAVALGTAVGRLPRSAVAVSSCLAFALAAYSIWRESEAPREAAAAPLASGFRPRGALAGFTAVFFAEWGDPGQMATAAFAARYHAPLVVWLAACAAMATKAVLALSLGSMLHRYAPKRAVRWAGASLVIALAISAAIDLRR